ncbi:MAG: PLP-dependent aminotransferase family protein, partial [Candidatus Binatia bacterium]
MELTIFPKRSDKAPLHKQIYAEIRDAILAGRVLPSDKLPSTRELSARLGLSRNTVNYAYERLLSEGYLESKRSSGTYVTTLFPAHIGIKRGDSHSAEETIALPRWMTDLEKWIHAPPLMAPPSALRYDFRPGRPTLDHFPGAVWRRIIGHHLRRLSPDLAGYDRPAGYQPLREAIATYLRRSRAVVCDADQVVVTAGAQQALDLLARLLLSPGEQAVLENPCYPAAVAVFRAARAKLSPVPVDAQGIQVDRLPQGGRLLYVTPSHQFPTGVLLPLSRRLALLSWARRYHTIILEDDYDCEFRYGNRPVESLQGLDRSGLV